MSGLNRRQLLISGIGAVILGGSGVALLARSNEADGWEHRSMPVAEMTADGRHLVDIRTPPEWGETGVIDGARLIEFDFNRPNTFLPQIADDIADGRDLVLICRSGNRSKVVAEFLAQQIPNRIVSIEGGIKKVIAGGYQTVPPK